MIMRWQCPLCLAVNKASSSECNHCKRNYSAIEVLFADPQLTVREHSIVCECPECAILQTP